MTDRSPCYWRAVGALLDRAGRAAQAPAAMRWSFPWAILLWLGGSLFATGLAQEDRLPPQTAAGPEGARTVFSTSRRFMVSGFAPAAAANLAHWAEDVAGRMESALGPLPMDRGWYLELQAVPGSQVAKAQGWVDGLLQQRLEVGRSEELDQEDALEGLVWLLLNRWPVQRQTVATRAQSLATVPDWLAAGLAQQLYPELRRRNATVVQERWQEGQLASWPELLEREILPTGRWVAKAESALLVDWLLERKARWEPLWKSCAEGKRMGADEFARQVLAMDGAPAAAQAWEVWLAGQQERHRGVQAVDAQQVAEFERWSMFEAADLQAVRAEATPPLALADLIALRRERWVPALAARRSWQLQMAMMSRAPEWQDVGRLYLEYLEALAGRGPGYTGGLFGRGPSARQLASMLTDAERARVRLRDEVQARTDYLDLAEATYATEGAVSSDPARERAERRFMDEMEQRWSPSSP